MTKRDFFKIAIRLFGLLALIHSIFQTLPSFVQYNYFETTFWFFMIVAVVVVLSFMFYRLLFIYSDKIIDWLHLERGFDDDKIILGESSFNSLIRLSLVLFGVYLVVINIPSFLDHLFHYFTSKINNSTSYQYDLRPFDWYYYTSELVMAGILILYNKIIADKISGDKESHDSNA